MSKDTSVDKHNPMMCAIADVVGGTRLHDAAVAHDVGVVELMVMLDTTEARPENAGAAFSYYVGLE